MFSPTASITASQTSGAERAAALMAEARAERAVYDYECYGSSGLRWTCRHTLVGTGNRVVIRGDLSLLAFNEPDWRCTTFWRLEKRWDEERSKEIYATIAIDEAEALAACAEDHVPGELKPDGSGFADQPGLSPHLAKLMPGIVDLARQTSASVSQALLELTAYDDQGGRAFEYAAGLLRPPIPLLYRAEQRAWEIERASNSRRVPQWCGAPIRTPEHWEEILKGDGSNMTRKERRLLGVPKPLRAPLRFPDGTGFPPLEWLPSRDRDAFSQLASINAELAAGHRVGWEMDAWFNGRHYRYAVVHGGLYEVKPHRFATGKQRGEFGFLLRSGGLTALVTAKNFYKAVRSDPNACIIT